MSNETQTAGTSQPAASAPAVAPAATPAPAAAQAPEASTILTADPAAQAAQTSAAPAQNPTQAEGQSTEAKTDEGKTKEVKVEGAPEEYAEFTAPEGMKFDEAILGDFKSLAKEHNLSQEVAQKFADIGAKAAQVQNDNFIKQIEAAKVEWANASRIDKEFGGDKLGENVAVAKKALDMFGSPELTEVLKTSGLGNHPEIIRAFYRVGQQISDDKFVPGGKAPSGAEKSVAQRMYPDMNP